MGKTGDDVTLCPSCGREHPADFAFCPGCGAKLAPEQSQANESQALTEERKVVTSLFCDLVSYTAHSEAADHELIDALLQQYNALAKRFVEGHGGVVEKFIGDAVLAVFGFPRAHDDDAERAVRCALRLAAEAGSLAWPDGDPVQVRIGVNTGETYLHTDVDPASGETFLTGDAVNTAARLETAAPPGGIVVGELTHSLTGKTISYEELEPLVLKGKGEPVPAWLAKEPKARTGLRTTGAADTPFIGREKELERLLVAFDAACGSDRARVLLLVGEPGIGKSRLVLELARALESRPELVTWRQGRCLAFGDGSGFAALADIVKTHAGILDSDDVATAEAKLEAVLPEGAQRVWLRQCLHPLLGLEPSQVSREESFAAWTQFLVQVASRGPAVYVIEDLHWAGEAMLAFVEHLLAQDLEAPLLIVTTARPELMASHQGPLTAVAAEAAKADRLMLEPLTEEEGAALLTRLLDAQLASGVEERMVGLVAGNPLYAEQYVRLLLDRGLLLHSPAGLRLEVDAELPLPDTVQAVLAARLDTLAPEQKALLCDAAVIGEDFWRGGIAALSGRSPVEVDETVATLTSRQLVRSVVRPSIEGEAEYVFWHGLARDVAYAQLPRHVRLEKHVAAAEWLEAAAGERAEQFIEVLAQHYVTALELAEALHDVEREASLAVRAGRHLLRAGEHSRSTDASKGQLEHALKLLPADAQERPRALFLLGEALSWEDLTLALDTYREALPGLRLAGEKNEIAGCLVEMAECLLDLNRPGWRVLVEEAAELIDEARPTQELVEILQELACVHYVGGDDCEAALRFADRSLSLAARLGAPVPIRALDWRGAARCGLGDQGGFDDHRRAMEEAAARGLGRRQAIMRQNYAIDSWTYRGPAAARPLFLESAELAVQSGMPYFGMSFRVNAALCLEDLGEWDRFLDEAGELKELAAPSQAGLDIDRLLAEGRILVARGRAGEAAGLADLFTTTARAEAGQAGLRAQCYGVAAAVLCALGARENARDLLLEGLDNSGAGGSLVDPGLVRVALACGDAQITARLTKGLRPAVPSQGNTLASAEALLAEARGEREAAAAGFADAAARWREFGVPYEEAQALLGQGRCLVALGRAPEAAAPLTAAREIFARLGAKPALEETRSLLGHVEGASEPAEQ